MMNFQTEIDRIAGQAYDDIIDLLDENDKPYIVYDNGHNFYIEYVDNHVTYKVIIVRQHHVITKQSTEEESS